MQHTSLNGLLKPGGRFIYFLFFYLVFWGFSCAPIPKSAVYFKSLKRDTSLAINPLKDFDIKISDKDVLDINVSSMNREEDNLFNNTVSLASTTGESEKGQYYTVDGDGYIQYHRLGKIKVKGLLLRQLKEKLEKDLEPYLKDPIVSVKYMNHKVTILGAVGKPQVLNMPYARMPLLDVLAYSGDITERGRIDDVLIIRETGSDRKVKRINLQDHSFLQTDWAYAHVNDVIYVSPDDKKAIREEKRVRFTTTYSLIITSMSFLVVILTNIFK